MISHAHLIGALADGHEEVFFSEYWRKRTLVKKGCIPHLRQNYSADRFLEDYRQLKCCPGTYLGELLDTKERSVAVPQDCETVESALKRGASMAVRILQIPQGTRRIPQEWDEFISLHRSLREYLCPCFPEPLLGHPSSVDLFYAPPTERGATIGGHYDPVDIFYLVLDGEREWTVELSPDLTVAKQLAMLPGGIQNLSNADRPPAKKCIDVTLVPGDCLYLPSFTYHRVCSKGASLALSLGIPVFDELSLIEHFLHELKLNETLRNPLPTYPRTQMQLFLHAKEKTRIRVEKFLRAFLDRYNNPQLCKTA